MPNNDDEFDVSFLDDDDSSYGPMDDSNDMFSESNQPTQPDPQPKALDIDIPMQDQEAASIESYGGDEGDPLDFGVDELDDDDNYGLGDQTAVPQQAQPQPVAPAPIPAPQPSRQAPQAPVQPDPQPQAPVHDDFNYGYQPQTNQFPPMRQAPQPQPAPVQQMPQPAPRPVQSQPVQRSFPSTMSNMGFIPKPVDVDLISKVIAILDDYRHLEKTYQDAIKGFMSALSRTEMNDLSEADVIQGVIDIDPGIRDAVHHFIESKSLNGADRAFYLMNLNSVQLNNLYNVFKMSAENLDGYDFKAGFHATNDTLPEIRAAASWLTSSIEAYPNAAMNYMVPLDKVLQDAKETMSS